MPQILELNISAQIRKSASASAGRPGLTADVVLANILPDVLIPLAGEIAARVAAGGTLILSGILRELADTGTIRKHGKKVAETAQLPATLLAASPLA